MELGGYSEFETALASVEEAMNTKNLLLLKSSDVIRAEFRDLMEYGD